MQWLAKIIYFKILGWQVIGNTTFSNQTIKKAVIIAAPHTSWQDFFIGILLRSVVGLRTNFIGKNALDKLKQEPLKKKLCCMVMQDNEGMALGKEPIYDESSRPVGYVTSTNYGYYINKHILYGYLPYTHSKEGTNLEVGYFGKRYSVKVTNEPLLDPENKRLKS